MNQKENSELKTIAKSVAVINGELGHVKINVEKLKTDMGWVKKILFGIAGMILVALGKILFFG